MPYPIRLITAALMFVAVATSSASAQTQELPDAITWLAPSGTSASNQGLENYYNDVTFYGSRRYWMPSSYAPDGMYIPPARIVWDDTLGYWDNSQVSDIGGYYTDDANSLIWWSLEAYYEAHPEAMSSTGEILQPAIYHPHYAINPVRVSTPGYRTLPDEVPRQYYAAESVNVYVALGDSMVAIQRTLTIFEKMPSGDDVQASSTTSPEIAYLDWSTGLFSTGEFYASFPQQQTDPGEGGDSPAQTTPTPDLVQVDLGYTRIKDLDVYHTFTLFTDTSICGGQQYVVRAGLWMRDGNDYLEALAEAYNENSNDRPSETVSLQKIGAMEAPISAAYTYGQNFASAVNSSNFGYNPLSWGFGYNSNSFTSTFLSYLGFSSVNTTLWTPGFNTNLPSIGIEPATFVVTGN